MSTTDNQHIHSEIPPQYETEPVNVQSESTPENRQIVTPYAFGVAPELIGTPLATPFRRGLALLVDLAIVTSLSSFGAEWLFVFLGLFCGWQYRKEKRSGRPSRLKALYLIITLISAIVVFAQMIDLATNKHRNNVSVDIVEQTSPDVTVIQAIKFGKSMMLAGSLAEKIESGECPEAMICWQTWADKTAKELFDSEMPATKIQASVKEALDEFANTLTEAQREQVSAGVVRAELSDASKTTENETDANKVSADDSTPTVSSQQSDLKTSNSVHSLIEWIKGIINDLGLGLSWAAAYFSVLTSGTAGQTIGKRIFGIKVIKLDGNRLSIWESFGRYGGYGAGIATGLMGFLQIYWDPNRQAIQDKIAETLVIRKV